MSKPEDSRVRVEPQAPCPAPRDHYIPNMQSTRNHLDQPVGVPLPSWTPPKGAPSDSMIGRYCRLEPFDPDRHAALLFAAHAEDVEGRTWTYLPYGPFGSLTEYYA